MRPIEYWRTRNGGVYSDWESPITNNDITYSPGDIINLNGFVTSGFLTTAKKDIMFSVPLRKKLNDNIEFQITGADIRQNGIYLLHKDDGVSNLKFSYGKTDSGINVVLTNPTTYVDGTNNDTVGVWLNGSLRVIK